ncbi:MAG: AbrB/MazE/SpoVT family DNA-binding domain-containing protein [Candidatus Marinimicrobia bacterium]|mgnify:FL=1|jgi:AbrB family looped-hinge helix DNA binding protein|nr:AbrB/MazE/SpoVT family DNA-binding domain-containing protein [Candidatus Neomarinimicrobiota bacterium]MBT4171864.1 AbrB/MazE/SpoVT family DNA-binding domain-containing protein [Candidatus Neomarinimicrobiota bacterium]MBT5539936.1 AbrB/MazE/SpoVT family DNA-binding domain-containing protein [Candidatus Neomarinimicrobiota bacterium]MBT6215530.1 AbrB/MazE/SpoVT family DNA-binding domain-containing protein [Candidatus Neomarinimicrobiota bacterium]MBT7022079.1 AbrB/MazE/SpoVT family DNA-bindi
MSKIATTKMSSKGQIVIPEDVRNRLGLKSGDRFMVIGDDGVVVLKALQTPDLSEFDELIESVRLQASLAGVTESDIEESIQEARATIK